MTSHQTRQQFLDFFQSKGHRIVPSAPLVLKNDPTLMFTNSGMAQFKDYFLGNQVPPSRRIADTQKCLRVTGKHNDLEDVGHDTYHHTMFEMLGNWSFGDYFKKDALAWSWELLTEVYKLPKDRLYASVFGGDEAENLEPDHEALEIWRQFLPEDRILFGSKKDNFWEMGDTGPCGPCSEIHIDLRSDEERRRVPGRERVNNDDPLVVEIWNNVFMQFERRADGSLVQLPEKHVDTGMGFERLCMAIQGKQSNYDTDIFQPLIQKTAQMAGKTYGQDKPVDIAMRVIADHIRAVSFAIADGQLPANAKAGYVIRRILRRAVRYGYTYLGFREPFMCALVPVLADQFKDVFPELKAQQEFVTKVVREEENSFLRTLENGLRRLDEIIAEKKTASVVSNGQKIGGGVVFELYDTYGFPVDLTALIARENSLGIDEPGFETEMQAQKDRSKTAAAQETGDWVAVSESDGVEFLGYDQLEAEARIVKYRAVKTKDNTLYHIVLDRTPFYAESGGQTGDTGELLLQNPATRIRIIDTKKENDLIIHITGDDLEKYPGIRDPQAEITARVDTGKRHLTENNHTATHLMQAALRETLGTHVAQRGSLVNDKVLRFDFSHFGKLTDEEIAQVERTVNRKIRENIALDEKRNVPIDKAKVMGATALFGEKYGDFVRVITFGPDYSVELCGGTHVKATGQIGLFKIVSESASAAGVRRIEAVTAQEADKLIGGELELLAGVKELLKNPRDLKKALEDLLDEKGRLQKQLETYENRQLHLLKDELLKKIRVSDGVAILSEKVVVPSADALKHLAYELKANAENLLLVLAADIQGKPQIAVMITDNILKDRNLHAGNIVKELAKEIKGGGGGQPFFATAGGTDVTGLDRVVERGKMLLA